MWCFGPNYYGELGNGGSQTYELVPDQIDTVETFVGVDGGGRHACAITTDADLWCWGHNQSGQVGDGSGSFRVASPVEVDTASWRSVDGGERTTCGVRTDDSGWCWGTNDQQQLGPASSQTEELTPARVPGSWSSLDAGDYATCGVAADQHVYCWGTVYAGGLGDATTTTSATPVLVLG